MGYFAPRKTFKKHSLKLMCFSHILHKNSIGHLLRTSRDYFRPPPPLKVLDNNGQYFIIFLCTFSNSNCCVCCALTKIWPKNIDFYHFTAIMLERGLFLPLPFHTKK